MPPVLALLVPLMVGAAPEPQPEPLVTVRGRILDEGGAPVAGARVELYVGFSLKTRPMVVTDAEGRYAFDRVPLMTPAERARLTELLKEPLGHPSDELAALTGKQAALFVTKAEPPDILRRRCVVPHVADGAERARQTGVLVLDITLPPPFPLKEAVTYWPNGRVKSRGKHFVQPAGPLPHGLRQSWYETGELEEEATWAFGHPVGLRHVYWPNGKLKIKERYDQEGHAAEVWCYYENGQLGMHGTLKHNPESPWKGVFFNDPLDWGADFNPGDHHGIWSHWDAAGKLLARGEWRDGKPWSGTCQVRVWAHGGNPLLLGSNFRLGFQTFRDGRQVEAEP